MNRHWQSPFFLVLSAFFRVSSSGDEELLLLPHPLIFDRRNAEGGGEGYPENLRLPCASWQFAGEANNLAPWWTVPLEYGGYVREYMTSKAYGFDLQITAREAAAFAHSVLFADNGKDAWVLDVDEIMLSKPPYCAEHGFGFMPHNWIYLILHFVDVAISQ